MNDVLCLNVTKHTIFDIFNWTKNAPLLISENGSILMNIFLSRTSPYFVLSSPRAKIENQYFYEGGYKYNEYHKGLINYIYGNLIREHKHPYSDQCYFNYTSLEKAVSRLVRQTG